MKLLTNNLISSHRIFPAFILVLVCGLVFLPGVAKATTETFTTAGLGTWVAPAGVTSVIVDTWAGGGGGGGSSGGDGGGGGGGGGGFASTTVTVVPGNSYSYYVGAGGTAGTATTDGGTGQDSMFQASTTVLSKGGGGGGKGTDGVGGTAVNSTVGTVFRYGGNGGNGIFATNSGGGGGGAGSTGNGTGAVNETAGSGGSPDGGNGAAGNLYDSGGIGSAGSTIGGGGSGGMRNGGSNRAGGAGARGQIILTYTIVITAPTLTTSAPASVATSTLTLNANISATGGADATEHGFAWGTSSTLSGGSDVATTTGGAFSGTGDFTSTSARNLSALTPATLYYFRAYAVNSAGTSTGAILSTTTLAVSAPTLTTEAASSVTATTATGNGTITVTGNINPTVRGVVYGLTTSYGATTTPENGNFSIGAFTASITGLTCNTLYHTAAYATNSQGTGYGSDATFTTTACVPTLTTSAASSVAQTSATLNGTISDTGGENVTTRGFQYGTTDSYGSTASESGSYASGSYSLSVSSLACNTTYHYRAYATNSAGSSYGSDTTFTTTSCPGSVIIFTLPANNPPAPNNPPPANNPPVLPNPPPADSQSTITTLEQIQSEARLIVNGKIETILTNFITNGTETTKILGSGERAGVVLSFKSAFGRSPKTESDWSDCLKIANGRWPSQRSVTTETNAAAAFKKIYLRNPKRNNPNDDAAVTVISYGLRPPRRNLNSERTAIKSFMSIYGYAPKSVSAWDIVRAIAYSGAKR